MCLACAARSIKEKVFSFVTFYSLHDIVTLPSEQHRLYAWADLSYYSVDCICSSFQKWFENYCSYSSRDHRQVTSINNLIFLAASTSAYTCTVCLTTIFFACRCYSVTHSLTTAVGFFLSKRCSLSVLIPDTHVSQPFVSWYQLHVPVKFFTFFGSQQFWRRV